MLSSLSVSSQNLTYEIILTLGQAFEVAYQLALQAQKSRAMGASAAAMIETKSSKPVPKPRVGVRKSAVRAHPPSTRHPRAWVELGIKYLLSPWQLPQESSPLPLAPLPCSPGFLGQERAAVFHCHARPGKSSWGRRVRLQPQ